MISRAERFRRWVVVICYGLTGAIFWGGAVAIAVRYIFNIEPEVAIFFIGLPVALLTAIYIIPKLPRLLRFDG